MKMWRRIGTEFRGNVLRDEWPAVATLLYFRGCFGQAVYFFINYYYYFKEINQNCNPDIGVSRCCLLFGRVVSGFLDPSVRHNPKALTTYTQLLNHRTRLSVYYSATVYVHLSSFVLSLLLPLPLPQQSLHPKRDLAPRKSYAVRDVSVFLFSSPPHHKKKTEWLMLLLLHFGRSRRTNPPVPTSFRVGLPVSDV